MPENGREKLTPERFMEYVNTLYPNYENNAFLYLVTISEGIDNFWNNHSQSLINEGATKEEFVEMLNGIGYRDGLTADEVLRAIPEIYRGVFEDLGHSILKDNFTLESFGNALYEKVKSVRSEVAPKFSQEISSYDLSLIPADMLAKFEDIGLINFENTNANLDLSALNYHQKIYGSIKGCNLISFDPYRYAMDKSDDKWHTVNIDAKDVDKEQYQVILDGYRLRESTYFPDFILRDEDIQRENSWIFTDPLIRLNDYLTMDYIDYGNLSDNFVSLFSKLSSQNQEEIIKLFFKNDSHLSEMKHYSRFWEAISEENKSKYAEIYFEKIMDRLNSKEINIDDYFYLRDSSDMFKSIFSLVNKEQIASHEKEFRELCFNQTDKFIERVWSQYPADIKLEQFDSIYKELYAKGSNLSALRTLLSYGGSDVREYISKSILDLVSNSDGTFDVDTVARLVQEFDLVIPNETIDILIEGNEDEKVDSKDYLKLIKVFKDENRDYLLENDKKGFINALKKVCNSNNEVSQELLDSYTPEIMHTLFEVWNTVLTDKNGNLIDKKNTDIIVNNLPILGENIVLRVCKSNSEMISSAAPDIIAKLASVNNKQKANEMIEEIEDIFSDSRLPSFMKIYKYYEMIVDKDKDLTKRVLRKDELLSPVLKNADSEQIYKKIVFSDLMKISLDSNNKSLRSFIYTIENGNSAYVKLMQNKYDESILTPDERKQLQDYIKTLYILYEDSNVCQQDKRDGKKVTLTGNLGKDAEKLGSRYCMDGKTDKLPDMVFSAYIGPYKDLFGGLDSIKKMREYMDSKVEEANEKHFELAKREFSIGMGDLIKGINHGFSVFPSILKDGVRAGEFLGISHHTDATPLDTDMSFINEDVPPGTPPKEAFDGKAATGWEGSEKMYIVLKNDSSKFELTRKNGYVSTEVSKDSLASRIENRNETGAEGEIRKRLSRMTSGYDDKKIEVFNSEKMGQDHYGIRTGFGSSDIDMIIVGKYDKRMGYELAMNGTYIPIYEYETGSLLFSPEQYMEIRNQMQGLSYYRSGKFDVRESASLEQTGSIIEELFPNPESSISTSELEANKKRNAITRLISEALEEVGISIENTVTGNMTDGFAEFIDTGSTGRGTNLPKDGDFDFMLKLDRAIIENPQKLEEIKEVMRKKIAGGEVDKETALDELGGNFRYKKVHIEGLDNPVDIDITFGQKDENVTYSTDMCVRDRLDHLKEDDLEGYKLTVANIVLAKRMLKEKGCYKKKSSPGSTELGGFGGVGVESWILQNGGSFKEAITTFLDAAEECKDFDEFKEKYPIFDFGENHMATKGARNNEESSKDKYQHDSFIMGVNPEKFEDFKKALAEIRDQLIEVPMTNKQGKTPFQKSFESDILEEAEKTTGQEIMDTLDSVLGEKEKLERENDTER